MDKKLVLIILLFLAVVFGSILTDQKNFSLKPRIVAEGGSGHFGGDFTPPSITNIQDSPDPVNQNSMITISALVTDNVDTGGVRVQVNNQTNYTLYNIGGNTYQTTSVPTSSLGTYNYKIIAFDSSNNEATSVSNTFNVVSSSGTCTLTNATWSTSNAQEGTYLTLIVNGNNCGGQQVNIELFEEDEASPRDNTGITKTITFSSNTQVATKIFAKWLNDDETDSDPEYIYEAKLVSNPSTYVETANTLKVTQVNSIGLLGNSLPGDWVPFNSTSPWNKPLGSNPTIHTESSTVVNFATTQASKIRFSNSYMPPIWVVDSDRMPQVYAHSSTNIYDYWDVNGDDWSDVPVPIVREMYDEPTNDGHIIIVDPFKNIAWEMSRFNWPAGQDWVDCTTFNIWNLSQKGHADYDEWGRWTVRGGRGSGVPVIAGLLRPEEIATGEIKHALAFTFPSNRMASNGDNLFIAPPSVRSDGDIADNRYPVEGMLFQLNPALTDAQFNSWGLSNEAKIVARALQQYGAYDVDKGGAMAFQPQLLGPDQASNRAAWDALYPNLYSTFDNIPTSEFRIIYTYPYSQRPD